MESGEDSLKPVPVDLEDLADALEGDPMTGGGILDLETGEVFPECVIEYMRDDEGIDLYETVENQLGVDRLGSHEAYQDMVDYIATLTDDHLADLLTVAVTGRGPFRRFKDVLADRTGTLEPYFAFANARKHQRAAAWLADQGYVSTHTRWTQSA
ncbi:hypothetical protein ABH935_004284 [Catenulispora sp. GAS73]|uniref:UPF0158 family protein n=1 Tax=Catenulispora sp. GAS73 TaxID=3156269 RepID=UPI0035140408